MISMGIHENIAASSDEPRKGALVESITLPVGNALQYLMSAFASNRHSKVIKAELNEIVILVTNRPSDDRVLDELKRGAFLNGPTYESFFDTSAGRYPSYVVTFTSDPVVTLRMQGLDALHDLVWAHLMWRTDLRSQDVMAQLAE